MITNFNGPPSQQTVDIYSTINDCSDGQPKSHQKPNQPQATKACWLYLMVFIEKNADDRQKYLDHRNA
jgi:hypothetical protein